MRPYSQDWKRYRRLRFTAILFWLGILPYAWLLQFLDEPFVSHTMRASLLVFYGAFWFVAIFCFEFFSCPRCGQFFATTWLRNRSFFASKCVHCGLGKFDDGEMTS